MQYSMKSGHAPANFAFVAVLTSSFALLAFSKYWRAQIAPLSCYTASVASAYWFLQSFSSMSSIVLAISDYPLSCPYCFCRFHLLFFIVLRFAELDSSCNLRLSSFTSILHLSLQLIGFYSPSLRWDRSSCNLRLSSFTPILHRSLPFNIFSVLYFYWEKI